MRIAAIYDIHANLPALDAVLHDVRQAHVDQVVVGGDVLPGPIPAESMKRLLELDIPVQFIQGNGDREVLAAMRGTETGTLPQSVRRVLRWVAQQLPPEYEQVLASWPETLRIPMPALGDVLFCHSTPRNDTEIFTRLTPEDCLIPVFEGVDAQVVVCGHTHMQFQRIIGGIRVVNAGSVGMPFGEPGAYWLLLGDEAELRRTDYDLTSAADRIRDTEYPQAEEFAAKNILQPPSEGEMLEAFTRAELRPSG
jgi:putative phosphoesterase